MRVTALRRCGRRVLFNCSMAAALSVASVSTLATSASAKSTNSALKAAKAAVLAGEKPVKWTPPAGAGKIKASKLRGDSVALITNGQNQFTETVGAGMVAAGKAAGVKVITDYTDGSVSAADTAIGNAISAHVKAIAVMSFESAALEQPLARAASHGIKILQIGEHAAGPLTNADRKAGVVGNVASCYACAGQLMADFVAEDSGGNAHVLFLNSPDVGDANIEKNGFVSQLHKVCKSCTLKTAEVPIEDWTSQLPGAVSSAITADPKLGYIVPVFDEAFSDFSAAITASGRASSLKMVGYNDSSAELKLMAQGTSPKWVFDGGYDETELGWATLDEVFRALLGAPRIVGNVVQNQWFNPQLVKRLNLGGSQDSWYGHPAYEAGYMKLWGLKG